MDVDISKLLRRVKRTLLGRPLHNDQMSHEKLSVFWGLPIMASDAVSSVAYAIEEVLLVLVPAIALAAYAGSLLVALPILLLLGVLIYSYAQIIKRYPNGGGAYVVTKENFGVKTSLLASSTLLVAYVLTVSVSVASATQALASAFPVMDAYRLPLCLFGIALLTLLNLRGVGESAKIFGVPTYLFILLIVVMLGTGFARLLTGDIQPANWDNAQAISGMTKQAAGSVSLFLFLRAFSSGCSALTGVEAVSNAVPLFKEPSRRTAIRVLCLLGVIILVVFGGTMLLSSQLKLPLHLDTEAADYETVLSIIARKVFGGLGAAGQGLYYALQGFTMLILLLAANTAYSGLPQLLAILGADSYMPRHFAHRGAKLSFSNGILFIWIAASALVIVFNADTHRMIPLYAAGVFITFTLSQAGMLKLWSKEKSKGWLFKAVVNACGTIITTIGGVTVLVVRFLDGAWLLFLVLPLLMLFMYTIHKRYMEISVEITQEEFRRTYRKSKSQDEVPAIVMMSRLTRSGLKMLNYANSITHNVKVLSVVEDNETAEDLRARWKAWDIDVELVIISAPFREIIEPLHDYISEEEAKLGKTETLTVLLTKVIDRRWYSIFIHNQTSFFLVRELSRHRKVVTILVPFIHE